MCLIKNVASVLFRHVIISNLWFLIDRFHITLTIVSQLSELVDGMPDQVKIEFLLVSTTNPIKHLFVQLTHPTAIVLIFCTTLVWMLEIVHVSKLYRATATTARGVVAIAEKRHVTS